MRRRIRAAAFPLHRHSLAQLAVDGALVALAYWLAFPLRFTNGPTGYYAHLRERTIWWVLAGSFPVLLSARVYQRRWRYSGQRDYEAVLRGVLAIVVLTVVGVAVVRPVEHATRHGTAAIGLPNGVIVLFGLLALVFLVGVRALTRSVYERRPLAAFRGGRKGERSVLIAGAGEGGRLVVREIVRNRGLGLAPVGFLDDDPAKRRMRVDGVRVRGNTEGDLPRVLDDVEPDEVIIAIPSAPGSTRARIVRECRTRGIPVRTLPTVFELLQTRGALARQMREVRVEDVLGREPVQMELARVGGVRCFVLVSTDKAVAAATLRGASKALAEFALEAATARFPATCYAAVRFGNVLGSSGSVVPIFRRQIERGGPVTVTDERMTRYFMTIPEAVQLIIRSGSLACAPRPEGQAPGANVFVLEMGEPVRIVDLARAMIELCGLDP